MDQVPLEFTLNKKRTLSPMGEPTFLLKPHGSVVEKRQASLQLCIRAEGEQIVRLGIIFRGRGIKISAAERKLYLALSPLLQVYFQPKAWADGLVSLAWLEQFRTETESLDNVLLGMDCHGAQQTAAFRGKLAEYTIQPVYTPPKCTDQVSPCDHHVGRRLKYLMELTYKQDFEANWQQWANFGLSARDVRMKLALWAAVAWHQLRNETSFLRSAFVSTGFLIAKDGSQDNLIKIGGINNYSFRVE